MALSDAERSEAESKGRVRVVPTLDTKQLVAKTLTKAEIDDLPIADRLELIATLWDSIDPSALPVPESHRRAFDNALDEYARDPHAGESWDSVRDDLFPKK